MDEATPKVPAPSRAPAGRTRLGVANAFAHLALLAGGLAVAFPFYWMVITALKSEEETAAVPPTLFPHVLHWENFGVAWNTEPLFGRYFLNTVGIALAVTLGVLVTSSLSAHAFARMRFFGRPALFLLLLATMMIPFEVILIPDYLLITQLHWQETYLALSVPWMASVFGIFLLRQFFLGIPGELWEAATLDGCGHLTYLFRIAVPLARPGLSVVAIVTFLGSWNALLWPLVVVAQRPEIRPIQLGLSVFTNEMGTKYHLVMAAALFTILPIILLFLAAQRQFVESLARTGVKG